MVSKITIFLFFLGIFQFSTLTAQEKMITGTVISDGDGMPLPGVNVVVKGTSTGTITDFDGKYSISATAEDVLVFSSLGMKTKELKVGGKSELNVRLETDLQSLDEVIVTSFGIEQQKKSLGYSVQEIKSEDIIQSKLQNIVSALQGQIAGVQITNSSGAPGQSSRIIIRGVNSLDPNADNQPLFVVDGVPIDNSTVESGGTPRGLTNRAADINPNDIESMSVLKGAAATAL